LVGISSLSQRTQMVFELLSMLLGCEGIDGGVRLYGFGLVDDDADEEVKGGGVKACLALASAKVVASGALVS